MKTTTITLEMHFNLNSIGKLDDEDYHNYLGGGQWKLSKGSLILTRRLALSTRQM
jgi:hypothetical protein